MQLFILLCPSQKGPGGPLVGHWQISGLLGEVVNVEHDAVMPFIEKRISKVVTSGHKSKKYDQWLNSGTRV
jgi:hypothetical protein